MNSSRRTTSQAGWYAVTILFVGYLLSIVDRQILSLFLIPIQQSLQVSDTAMGILHGFTFAIFYAVMGLPIARMIDSGNRRVIIMSGIVLWSLATAACGLATEYWHLLIARIFVGVGEATLLPGTVSLIADYFPREERGRAMGVFASGGATGNGLSMLSGALIAGLVGASVLVLPGIGTLETWQLVFIIVGMPGLILAVLVLTLKEPGRSGSLGEKGVPLSDVVAYVDKHRKTYASILLGSSIYFIAYLAHLAWTPALLIRRFGMSPQEAGLVFGLVLITCGPLGSAVGGWLADRRVRNGETDGKLRLNIIAAIGLTTFGMAYPLIDDLVTLVVVMVPCVLLSSILLGTAPACIQDITPGPMRGQLTALYTGLLNLIGFGLGPLAVALLTDYLFRDPTMLNYSMSLVIGTSGAAATVIFILGLGSFRASLAESVS